MLFVFEEELKRARHADGLNFTTTLYNSVQGNGRRSVHTSWRAPPQSASAAWRNAGLVHSRPVSFRPRRAGRAWRMSYCWCNRSCSCHAPTSTTRSRIHPRRHGTCLTS